MQRDRTQAISSCWAPLWTLRVINTGPHAGKEMYKWMNIIWAEKVSDLDRVNFMEHSETCWPSYQSIKRPCHSQRTPWHLGPVMQRGISGASLEPRLLLGHVHQLLVAGWGDSEDSFSSHSSSLSLSEAFINMMRMVGVLMMMVWWWQWWYDDANVDGDNDDADDGDKDGMMMTMVMTMSWWYK